jgi:hypothetical protein
VTRVRLAFSCLLATVAVGLCAVGGARASGYWNVYQDYMPAGTHATTLYQGGGSTWVVRMSWTPNLQNMYFLFIGYYDRYMYYSGYARAGCQNPANGDNPWVNCRNASAI